MRILVIGGTKFIGPPVLRQLVERGDEVMIYHRGQHEASLPGEICHIHDEAAAVPVVSFPPAVLRFEPEVVLHMFPVGKEDARAMVQAFCGLQERPRRIVAISSQDVYRAAGRLTGWEPGAPEPLPLDEDAPLRSRFYPYGGKLPEPWADRYEKILAERELMAAPELPATILRLPAVYGPGDYVYRFYGYVRRMAEQRPFILMSKSQASWRWTHSYVEDVGYAIALAVRDDRAAGRIYNVGEAQTPTWRERVETLARLMDWPGEIIVLPPQRMPEHLRDPFNFEQSLVASSNRIRRELGFVEPVAYEEGLRRTIAWLVASQPADSASTTHIGRFDYVAEDYAAGWLSS